MDTAIPEHLTRMAARPALAEPNDFHPPGTSAARLPFVENGLANPLTSPT